MVVHWENERNGWEMNDNFENEQNQLFEQFKKPNETGRSRTMKKWNEKNRAHLKVQLGGNGAYVNVHILYTNHI